MSIALSSHYLPAIPTLPVRRFTVEEYHRLIETGILQEGDPYELIDGWIVPKTTRSPLHDAALGLVEDEINRLLPPGWFRRGPSAITASPDSEPEPDLAVVRGERRDYGDRHPGPQDMGVVIEVADKSLRRDQGEKLRLYARTLVPIYWIVNLINSRVEVYAEPTGPAPTPRYQRRLNYATGDTVPFVLDGVEVDRIPVRALLP